MAFTTKKIKEKEDILFKVKQSNPSPYLWQQKMFIERLFLVPQYLLAYGMMFDIYVIYYIVVKPYGIIYFIITAVGLFADGTTYTQLFCLLFSFWSFSTSIVLRLFLSNPERLQWFYNIVGEKRVKPLLLNSSLVKLFISRTAPVLCGLIVMDLAIQMISEDQFQVDKRGASLLAQETW